MRYRPVAVVVLVSLAACGGSDSENGDSRRPAGPSADERDAGAEFVRRVDAVCKDTNPELAAIQTGLSREAAFYEALIGSVDKGASNLRRQVGAAEAQDAFGLRRLAVEGSVINARGKGLIAGHGGFRLCGRG